MTPRSLASNLGFEAYWDYILSLNHKRLDTNLDLLDLLKNVPPDTPLVVQVYNGRDLDIRGMDSRFLKIPRNPFTSFFHSS